MLRPHVKFLEPICHVLAVDFVLSIQFDFQDGQWIVPFVIHILVEFPDTFLFAVEDFAGHRFQVENFDGRFLV